MQSLRTTTWILPFDLLHVPLLLKIIKMVLLKIHCESYPRKRFNEISLLELKSEGGTFGKNQRSNWLAKYTESDLNEMIRVQFVGEPAVDQGGPRNEFFCLLHREVCGCKMFIGNQTCKLFNHNRLALEQRNYFMYGQLCSFAIMQGSPAPSFLSPTLADYIVVGELNTAQSRIDVFHKEVRDKLKELKITEDPEEFKRVASFECALRLDAGFCKPIVTSEGKVKMLHIITLHYTLLQSLAEVNQFIEGLKLNGLQSACDSTLMKKGNCSPMKTTRFQEKNLTIFWSHYLPSLEAIKENWKRGCLSILPGILKMSLMQRLRGPLKILTQRKNLTLLSQQAWCCSSLQAHITFQLLSSTLYLL